ncbi:Fucose permease [Chitinophaga costaii]|uniref:Fucose permease n=1 Tax=Chitinophaga costaii TaxID=1335309 RepID=A0A1C4G235_9BACT|nr:MFS transporter [Chitinophaga costaii]PUZ19770.1 MFS transporter [Chitinophaga costaii]SCC62240.1 Fucose permease [Chitinophaga costaii]
MKRSYYIVGLIMLTFFVISLLTNITGPLVPDIINGFQLKLSEAGLLPFTFFIAYGIVSIPAGILLEKYKEKKIMVTAFAVAFAGSLLLAFWPNYGTALGSLFLIGGGMAMLQVVINPLLRAAGGEEHYAFNSVLAQLIFGLASFASPKLYSWLVERLKDPAPTAGWLVSLQHVVPPALPWVSLYWLFVVICLVMMLILLLSRFPKVVLSADEVVGSINTHIALFKKPVVQLYFFGIFAYVGTEQCLNNWMSQFLFTYHHIDPQTVGADTVANFWGLMTAGGVLGLLLLKVMDSRKVLISFTVLAIISFAAALYGSSQVARVAFPMVGFFASVMYPVIFSLALNSIDEHHGSFAGILITGIIGGALLPLLVGWVGDMAGLRTGMAVLFVTMTYILSIGIWAKPIITNKTINLFKTSQE